MNLGCLSNDDDWYARVAAGSGANHSCQRCGLQVEELFGADERVIIRATSKTCNRAPGVRDFPDSYVALGAQCGGPEVAICTGSGQRKGGNFLIFFLN